jgi:hypothetical protein
MFYSNHTSTEMQGTAGLATDYVIQTNQLAKTTRQIPVIALSRQERCRR